MEKMITLEIKMSKPIKIGICNEGRNVYQILTWCDGQEAKEVLPSLSEEEQYKFGLEAGKILLKMQTIENYNNCGRKLENDVKLV